MISTRAIPDEAINAAKIQSDVKKGIYACYYGDVAPHCATVLNSYGAPTGTGGDINSIYIPGPYPVRGVYNVKGTQTLLAPLLGTSGLDISQDQTDNDGVEYVFGGPCTAQNLVKHTVGTTPDSFIRIKLKIADVSGTDDCAVGFRKLEAFQANIDDYDEAAFINVILGNVKTETILNGGTTVTSGTLTTWADGAEKELKVVLKARKCYFYVNGVRVATPSHQFDLTEVVVPFFFFLQATTTPGLVHITELEYGRLQDIDSEGAGY